MVTRATVAAFAAVIPSMPAASATTPKPFIIDLIVPSIRLFWTPNHLAIETDATVKSLDRWKRAPFSARGARLRGSNRTAWWARRSALDGAHALDPRIAS